MTGGNETHSPLTCRVLGHKWHPEAAEYYCQYFCVRCDHEGYSDGSIRERIGLKWWLAKQWAGGWLRVWWHWLRCDECGRWFGRHDESADHIPF